MAYRIQRLGWLPDPPDYRDFHDTDEPVARAARSNVQLMMKHGEAKVGSADAKKLPRSTDLRATCSDIEDQGNIGSCTAFAVVGLVEYLQRSLYGEHLDASHLFLYKVTRSLLGWTGDTGAFVRSAIKALRLFGVPPDEYYPYRESVFDDEPPAFSYAFAGNYKAIGYYRLDGLKDLKESLAAGIPFAFGFTCYSSLFTDAVNRTGDIPFPRANEEMRGGHAVMGVGYDDAKGRLLIRNSWGRGWGADGYGTLPYEFVERGLALDFWALVKMDVVPLKE